MLTENYVRNGTQDGIYIRDSNANSIIENNIENNEDVGIHFDEANNNIIENNLIKNNILYGIKLDTGHENIIINNLIENNGKGLAIKEYSESNIVEMNDFLDSGREGIQLEDSTLNTIRFNTIQDNEVGMRIEQSTSGNTIYHNLFNNEDNVKIGSDAINNWNVTSRGNYWTNPEGTGFSEACIDSDLNGICDLPYMLDDYNIDYLPLTSFVESEKNEDNLIIKNLNVTADNITKNDLMEHQLIPFKVRRGSVVKFEFEVLNNNTNGSAIIDDSFIHLTINDIYNESDLPLSFFAFSGLEAQKTAKFNVFVNIPDYAEEGEHVLKIELIGQGRDGVIYTDEVSLFMNILNSESENIATINTSLDSNENILAGKEFIVDATIKSLKNSTSNFFIQASEYESWGALNSISQRIFDLAPGESKNITFSFTPYQDVVGEKSFIIGVLSEGVSTEKQVFLQVNQPQPEVRSFVLTKTSDLSQTKNGTFKIENVGDVRVSSIKISDNNARLKFAPDFIDYLEAGESRMIDVSLADSSNLDFGDNSFTVKTQDETGDITNSLIFTVRKTFCETGKIGDLKIDNIKINNLDGNDETWKLTENVEIEVDVKNIGREEINNVIAELGLFDSRLSNVIDDLEFDSDKEIDLGDLNPGDDEKATFSFMVPVDFEDGNYRLVIKTYSDENREENLCIDVSPDLDHDYYNEINVEREKNKNKLIIFNNVEMPEEVECGDSLTLHSDVLNVGNKNQDRVRIKLVNDLLDIDEFVELYDLDKGYQDRVSLDFDIPNNISNGNYSLVLSADYDYSNVKYKTSSDNKEIIPIEISCEDSRDRKVIINPINKSDGVIRLKANSTNKDSQEEGFFSSLFEKVKSWFN